MGEVRRALTLCVVILTAAVPSVAAAQTPNLGEVVHATTDAVKAPLQAAPGGGDADRVGHARR